jgi:hypothetical protein
VSGNLPGTTAVIEKARPKRRTMMFTRDARDTTAPKYLGGFVFAYYPESPATPRSGLAIYISIGAPLAPDLGFRFR